MKRAKFKPGDEVAVLNRDGSCVDIRRIVASSGRHLMDSEGVEWGSNGVFDATVDLAEGDGYYDRIVHSAQGYRDEAVRNGVLGVKGWATGATGPEPLSLMDAFWKLARTWNSQTHQGRRPANKTAPRPRAKRASRATKPKAR